MNHEQIDAIAAVLRESRTLTEVEVRSGSGVSLRLRRPAPKAPQSLPTQAVARTLKPETVELPSAAAEGSEHAVGAVPLTASVVGIFRPLKSDAAISSGTAVKEGQLVGHIEAMRLLNDCLAPEAGTILRVLVEEGQPVEYGQLLFEIEPES